MKFENIGVFINGRSVIIVGIDKKDEPIDPDGTLFGKNSGRDIDEYDLVYFKPSNDDIIIIDPTCSLKLC